MYSRHQDRRHCPQECNKRALAGGTPAAQTAMAKARRAAEASVSCVIPALNEARSLAILLPMLTVLLRDAFASWEIIVVDDGSTDDTPAFMSEVCQREDRVRYLQLSRNFGKEAALSAGLELAVGQVVVTLDADLQHPPALIARMVVHWEQGADMVYAVREARADERLLKRIGTRIFYFLMKGTGKIRIEPDACDFRLMDRKVVQALCQLPERTRFMKGLYAWVGFRTQAVYYQPDERRFGTSRFNLFRLVGHGLQGLTAFTTWPLRMAMFGGMLLAGLALLYGLYVIFEYVMVGNPVRGYSTLIVAESFFAGIILISVGMVGEYVAHIYEEVKRRPLFIVSKQMGQGLSQGSPRLLDVRRKTAKQLPEPDMYPMVYDIRIVC
ncbi:putative glycosyl transferase [Advenella kashmirensis WT001]|uniref:Putative glycosyl transferase n=1 Tax=Advenella kashmirensis (strain DSM 17095 / LMG 22695 / WT001) TaxID=1036672 RepID=I3U9V3_ADVKW|nr:glycosyltransferase family 2 protein [Advenella kashmirensis]AFK61791.1 putative glycosyl transferase [Advenella kashmirensis WT001]